MQELQSWRFLTRSLRLKFCPSCQNKSCHRCPRPVIILGIWCKVSWGISATKWTTKRTTVLPSSLLRSRKDCNFFISFKNVLSKQCLNHVFHFIIMSRISVAKEGSQSLKQQGTQGKLEYGHMTQCPGVSQTVSLCPWIALIKHSAATVNTVNVDGKRHGLLAPGFPSPVGVIKINQIKNLSVRLYCSDSVS